MVTTIYPPEQKRSVPNDLLLRTIRTGRAERAPCWLMRQAGRYDPQYQRLRRECGLELEELFRHPELAAEITILPARLGVDALILFQDILTILTPMGAPFVFRPGPQLVQPIRSPQDLDALHLFEPEQELAFVAKSIEFVLENAPELPLLGFAGAPWTLAAFLLEGGSPHRTQGRTVRAFLREHPAALHRLLEKLTRATIDYLRLQIRAGIQGWQLFESCADLLEPQEYAEVALPYQKQIFDALGGLVPRFIFAKDLPQLHLLTATGAEVLSLSQRISLEHARAEVGDRFVLQGNVDNRLLHSGTPAQVRQGVAEALRQGRGGRHILNLGHGILEGTPLENVQAFLEEAQRS